MDPPTDQARKRKRSSASLEQQNRQILLLPNGTGTLDSLRTVAAPKKDGGVHQRASMACDTCRSKKVKCDEKQPACGYCKQHGSACQYRLQGDPLRDQILSLLFDRIIQIDQKLAKLLAINSNSVVDTRETGNNWTTPSTGVETPSLKNHESTPALHFVSENYSAHTQEVFPINPRALKAIAEISLQNTRYQHQTRLSCEESRAPLPANLLQGEITPPKQIIPLMEEFYREVHSLWPVVCEKVTYAMAVSVKDQGFQDNLQSCLILFMIALTKAYQTQQPLENGLPEFQRAVQLLGRLGVHFTLEFVQAQVLSAIFSLKIGRLMDFWSYLYMGCTILDRVIRQDAIAPVERSLDEKNTILRLYWLCYNLERDLNTEIENMPSTCIFQLEDTLILPDGCNEAGTVHMPHPFRSTQTFFLAETSLKSILARILATPNSDFYIENASETTIKDSPLFQELRTQLDRWLITLPTFVGWAKEPAKGEISQVATRLKLVYWFARLALFRPLILHVLKDPSRQFAFTIWKLFQEGALAGLNMIKVAVLEDADVDIIVGNRHVLSPF